MEILKGTSVVTENKSAEITTTKRSARTVLKYRKKGVCTSSDRMDRMLFRFMLSTAAYEQPQCGTFPDS